MSKSRRPKTKDHIQAMNDLHDALQRDITLAKLPDWQTICVLERARKAIEARR